MTQYYHYVYMENLVYSVQKLQLRILTCVLYAAVTSTKAGTQGSVDSPSAFPASAAVSTSMATGGKQAVRNWETLVLFAVNLSRLDVMVNMSNVMGNTV